MKIIVFALLAFTTLSQAARLNPERFYQDRIAASLPGAETEVTAGDRTRCDILTDSHAFEVDFADKWAESIGQSLNYGFQFDRKAGIYLILESPKDERHFIRLGSIIRHFELPIELRAHRAYSAE